MIEPPPPPAAPPPPTSGTDPGLLSEPQRQSPLAIVFLALRTIRAIGIVQIVVGIGFVLSRSPSILLLVVGAVIIGAVLFSIATLNWWRYTFHIENGEVRVNKGVLSKQALTVPLDRVQSVSIEQKFLHRLVGLVQVSLDTAGAQTAEFAIDAVDQKVATALQSAAADHAATVPTGAPSAERSVHGDLLDATPTTAEQVIIKHDPMRIVKVALTKAPFSGLAVLAPLVAFGDDIIDFVPFDIPEVSLSVGLWLVWFIPVAILIVLIGSVLLNLISTLLQDWDLTVTRTASGLRRNAGLLSKTSVASSLPRVQRIEVDEGVIERFFHLHTTTFHNIGDADMRVPGCTEDQVAELRQLGLDGALGVSHLDRLVSPLEVFKATRNAAVFFVAVAIGLFFAVQWWALLVLLLIPWVYLDTRRRTRLRRWGLSSDAIADRHEFVGRKTDEVLLRKINSVQVTQSLFERKRDLATVEIELAGGAFSGSLSIGMIPLSEAKAVRDQALFVAETDTRAFM